MTQNPPDSQEGLPGAALDWDDPSTLPVEEVRGVFSVLGKALRAQQLYDENNPVYQRFTGQLREVLLDLWEEMDRLQVQVEEDRLTWMGEEVYKSTSRSDSLAFLLYKDGLREITLKKGLETHELITFLDLLNRARDLRPEGDDLLTLLWEEELEYLEYLYVDLLAEGLELPSAGDGQPGLLPDVLVEEMGEGGEVSATEAAEAGQEVGGPAPGQVTAEDFNPTLYSLDPREMEEIQEELEQEMARDLRKDVLFALFDRVEEPRFPKRQREIFEVFRILLPNLLSRGALRAAGAVLAETARLLTTEGALQDSERGLAEKILNEVSSPETLRELIQALEEGTISPDPTAVAAFLGHLRSGALAPLLKAAGETGDREVRRVVQEAARGLGSKYRNALIRCLGSGDPVVAAEAVSLVGKIQLSEAGPRVADLLAHEAPGVRLAAVRAAGDLKASTAVGALLDTLFDPERDVRIAAARVLGRLRYGPAAPYLRQIVESKDIRQTDISEQIAFFESYGMLGDADALKVLDGILNGRGFFGRKESGEMRACAALGLGRMGTSEARSSLQKALGDQDPVVKSAVNRALRGEG